MIYSEKELNLIKKNYEDKLNKLQQKSHVTFL